MRKKISQFFVFVFISGLFVSCWDDFSDRAYYCANVTAFYFEQQDTCANIEEYVFNIDQVPDTGLIYNLDSLPFGRVVNHLFPSITLESTNGDVYFHINGKDSLFEDADTIDFTSPILFKNTSADTLYHRVYKISVNVHQVDPDSMIVHQKSSAYPTPTDVTGNKVICQDNNIAYSFFSLKAGGMSLYQSSDGGLTWSGQLGTNISGEVKINSLCVYDSKYYVTTKSGQLYSSVDGLSWEKSGDAKIVTLYGQLSKKYKSETDPMHLIGLAVNADGDTCYARSTDGINWTIGSTINSDFPVSEYAVAKDSTVTGVEFYTLATGLNSSGSLSSSIWTTETGESWVKISDPPDKKKYLVQRRGASLFFYDKYLVCFGGIDSDGNYKNDVYVSPDNGKGWIVAPDNWISLILDNGLANSNIYVQHIKDTVNDKDREILWIFGGTNNGVLSSAVWKGYINSMVFARR
jgi:hypothetical protein